jgi:hypothetical protein
LLTCSACLLLQGGPQRGLGGARARSCCWQRGLVERAGAHAGEAWQRHAPHAHGCSVWHLQRTCVQAVQVLTHVLLPRLVQTVKERLAKGDFFCSLQAVRPTSLQLSGCSAQQRQHSIAWFGMAR